MDLSQMLLYFTQYGALAIFVIVFFGISESAGFSCGCNYAPVRCHGCKGKYRLWSGNVGDGDGRTGREHGANHCVHSGRSITDECMEIYCQLNTGNFDLEFRLCGSWLSAWGGNAEISWINGL